jgi:hypothetical protein
VGATMAWGVRAAIACVALVVMAQAGNACPKIRVLKDTDRWIPQSGAAGPTVEAWISDARAVCNKGGGKAVVDVTFKLKATASGPGTVELPYFVASYYMHNAEPIAVYKDVVVRTLEFGDGMRTVTVEEQFAKLELPMGNRLASTDFEVFVGFQLNMEQLEQIRRPD